MEAPGFGPGVYTPGLPIHPVTDPAVTVNSPYHDHRVVLVVVVPVVSPVVRAGERGRGYGHRERSGKQ